MIGKKKKKSQNRALQLQFSATHVLLHTTRCHFKFIDILGQRIEIQKITNMNRRGKGRVCECN